MFLRGLRRRGWSPLCSEIFNGQEWGSPTDVWQDSACESAYLRWFAEGLRCERIHPVRTKIGLELPTEAETKICGAFFRTQHILTRQPRRP